MSFTVLHICAIQLADGDFVDTVRSVFTIMLFRCGQFRSGRALYHSLLISAVVSMSLGASFTS